MMNIRYANMQDIDFWLFLGYVKTGSLFFENEPEELMLIKKIST